MVQRRLGRMEHRPACRQAGDTDKADLNGYIFTEAGIYVIRVTNFCFAEKHIENDSLATNLPTGRQGR